MSYRKGFRLMFVAIIGMCVFLQGCSQANGSTSPNPEKAGIYLYQKSANPVQADAENEQTKQLKSTIEQVLTRNTARTSFLSQSITPEAVSEARKNNTCVEYVWEEPISFPLYGTDNSKTYSLKRILIVMDTKTLYYSNSDNYNPADNGPISLLDTDGLSDAVAPLLK